MLPIKEVIISGVILMAVAYLLGSLPFSVWIGKVFYRKDVREFGSGNAGATNTWRVLGWKAGLPVLLLDIAKGFGATFLPYLRLSYSPDAEWLLWLRILCGTAAALGHIYPLLAGFRGGKAVATLLGVIIGLMPMVALGSLAVFILVLGICRMVSLGSILAAISLPVLCLIMLSQERTPLLVFSCLITMLVIMTHRKNIQRIIRGEESRIRLRKT
jgi:acyl phosphate:glycerol-3-phosphate acyltransferase